MDKHGEEMIQLFASRFDKWRELLTDAKLRAPDKVFDAELKLDLGGGVTARLLWFGGAHTKGDELTFVEPDKTLISGDVVQNKVVPNIFREGSTPSSWIAVLDQVEKLGADHVLPTHSPVGDGSLVAKEKAFIIDLRTRVLASSNRAQTPTRPASCLLPSSRPRIRIGPTPTSRISSRASTQNNAELPEPVIFRPHLQRLAGEIDPGSRFF